MFTGLITEVGRVATVRDRRGVTVLGVRAPNTTPTLTPGASVAVNGICLTVTRIAGDRFELDASAETRRVTTLAAWRRGDLVHLEPALRAGDPMGGHLVLGHVDGVGRVVSRTANAGILRLTVGVDAGLSRLLLPKGSIAVDGVSLTLDEGPFHGRFTVTIIPHTRRQTRLDALGVGDRVNIELDVLAKAAMNREAEGERPAARGPLTMAAVLAHGWARTRQG